jgi:uncharacterized membrane protein
MPIRLRNDEAGRPWTLKEWVQGKPIGHPSHPMFVHFPIAFYLAVIVFDVMALIEPNAGLMQANLYLLIMAVLATVILVITGGIDWLSMVPRSRKRRKATQHLLVQVSAFVLFFITLLLRLANRGVDQPEPLWLILEIVGYVIIGAGQYLGGVLVYEMGMRVRTGGEAREPDERSTVTG